MTYDSSLAELFARIHDPQDEEPQDGSRETSWKVGEGALHESFSSSIMAILRLLCPPLCTPAVWPCNSEGLLGLSEPRLSQGGERQVIVPLARARDAEG